MNIGREIRESTIRKLTGGRTGMRTVRERGTGIPMLATDEVAGGIVTGPDPNDETGPRYFTIGRSARGGSDPIR